VYAAVAPTASGPVVTEEKINRIWSEISPRAGYRQLQIAQDASSAQFAGATGDDGATIQLPLIQVRASIGLSYDETADGIQATLKTIGNHLGLSQFFNLGIKHVYHAPVANHDAREFVLRRLLEKDQPAFDHLQRGADFWVGLKFGLTAPDGSFYLLTLEPWLADNLAVFVDLDAQFPGVVTLDTVRERAREAHDFARMTVKSYLDAAENTL
jgi:hypothetical protein